MSSYMRRGEGGRGDPDELPSDSLGTRLDGSVLEAGNKHLAYLPQKTQRRPGSAEYVHFLSSRSKHVAVDLCGLRTSGV